MNTKLKVKTKKWFWKRLFQANKQFWIHTDYGEYEQLQVYQTCGNWLRRNKLASGPNNNTTKHFLKKNICDRNQQNKCQIKQASSVSWSVDFGHKQERNLGGLVWLCATKLWKES